MKASIYNSTALYKAFDCRSIATKVDHVLQPPEGKAVILCLVVRVVCADVLFILRFS
jgi:hypothetical protein